jgi:glycosyltransferase involved in cell wall biosynthesis
MPRYTQAHKLQFTHLIPQDGVGGVEVAAKYTNTIETVEFDLRVDYIYQELEKATGDRQTYAVWPLIKKALSLAQSDVDVLVLSLWRACIVGLLVKVMRPKTKLVLFLHNTHDAHWMDKLFTRLSAKFCSELWVDCERTAKLRLPTLPDAPIRVVSYVTRRVTRLNPSDAPKPHFAFWGRLATSKNVARAIGIFQRIATKHPTARFTIIGPDGGEQQKLLELSQASGFAQHISFAGPVPHHQLFSAIGGASFFIQTSLSEGMSMATVEAMQMGMLPVVTPVGEVPNYCKQGQNAILVESDDQAVEAIEAVLADASRFHAMTASAMAYWDQKPLYRESITAHCLALANLAKARSSA